mmetsp:Transcript_27687/g.26705  ORF Transcript_27687/g.26705 Transcript_27687/m.26705 type:complete len:91 (+) Transcript_27687:2318-2590(+)
MEHGQWAISTPSYLCGPYENNTVAYQPITDAIEASSFASGLVNVVSFYPFLWLVALILATLMLFKKNHANLLKRFVLGKDQEYQLQIDEL